MKISPWVVLGMISATCPAVRAHLVPEWESVLPADPRFAGLIPSFDFCVRSSDGTYVASGGTYSEQRLVGVDAKGHILWTRDGDSLPDVRWEGRARMMRSHPLGFSVVRSVRVGPDLSFRAILYDPMGRTLSGIDLNVNSGFDLDTLGNLRSVANEPVQEGGPAGESPVHMVARMSSLSGGTRWVCDLGKSGNFSWPKIHDLGGGRTLVAAGWGGGVNQDSLKLWCLSSSGGPDWNLSTVTGKGDGIENVTIPASVVNWSAIAHTQEGGILVAGIGKGASDTLVLLGATFGGRLSWLRKYPVQDFENRGVGGFWEVSEAAPSGPSGFRLSVRWRAPLRYGDFTRMLEFDGEGRPIGKGDASPSQRIPMAWSAVPSSRPGSFLGFGASEDTLTSAPVTWVGPLAWSLAFPSLNVPDPIAPGVMRPLRLEAYADTVYARPMYSWERAFDTSFSETPRINFLLPTPDGGALAGGRLLRRTGADSLSVVMVKLAPGYAVGLAPGRRILRSAAGVPGVGAYDLLGRPRRGAYPPAGIFLTRPARAD